MPEISKIAIIGYGNVAQYLAQILRPHYGLSFFARRPSGEALHISEIVQFADKVDIVLLCVSDNAIEEVSAQLPASKALVAHVSGATDLDKIDPKHKRRGVFYPLMSIKSDSEIDPREIPFCLEAENEADYPLLETMAETLGASHHRVNSEQRTYLHIAAVLSQNFSNHLYHKSREILQKHNLDFRILLPLLKNSLQRLDRFSPKQMQTGPALRKDHETIQKHLKLMDDPATIEIYKLLSGSIQKTYDQEL